MEQAANSDLPPTPIKLDIKFTFIKNKRNTVTLNQLEEGSRTYSYFYLSFIYIGYWYVNLYKKIEETGET